MEKIGRKEIIVRQWFAEKFESRVPLTQTVQALYSSFVSDAPEDCVSYGLFNGVVKKLQNPEPVQITATVRTRSVPEILEIGSMEFPDFRLWNTHTELDKLFSDHEERGGVYSGTANIVVGESGVGKTTVMLDILAKIKINQPETKVLYISSEMTRNDLFFYYRRNPIIANIPTLLLMDYINGKFDTMLQEALLGDWDIILIDSYQDIVVKMTDVLGWKGRRAGTWLTNLIIKASDEMGKAVFAIQHMTKAGVYMGSTYLKHATTSMLEIRKDDVGRRYAEFSKNRRVGGQAAGKRLYYSLVDGEVQWAEEMLDEQEVAARDAAVAEDSLVPA